MDAVTHELKVLEELPPRRTLLNEQLNKIARNPEWYGKPVQIGSYAKVSAANGAKHLLQKRWGKTPQENGWLFVTRHIVEEGEDRTGLFAIFTPEAAGKKGGTHERPERQSAEAQETAARIEAATAAKAPAAPRRRRSPAKAAAPTAPAPSSAPQENPGDPSMPAGITPEMLERLSKVPNLDEILEAVGV